MRIGLLLLLFCLSASCVFAFDIMKLREIDASAVSDYPDIAQMKEEALLLYYYEENESARFGDFAEVVYDYSGEFVSQYKIYEKGGEPSFQRMRELLAGLGRAEWNLPLSASILKHAEDAFAGFVGDAARREATAAERDEMTRGRIRHYEKAAQYLEEAGDYVGASSIRGKRDELEKTYGEDMAEAGELGQEARDLYESALGSRNFLLGILAYADLMRSNADFGGAMALYMKHGENEKAEEIGQEMSVASRLAGGLSNGVFVFSALFAVLALAVALKIAHIARGWWGDEYDEGLGNEMI